MTPAEKMQRLARLEKQAELDEIKKDWQSLLEEEEAAFMRCVELDNQDHDRNAEKSKAVRHWWSLTNAILWMFTRTRAQFDHELQPFPMCTFGRLANISEELSNGVMPNFVADAGARRGRPRSRGERQDIAYGVLYIEAVRRGEITDRSPSKTVRQAFNVTAKAVQNWVKDQDKICVGVPHRHMSPERLRKKMLECAEVYSRVGRVQGKTSAGCAAG